MEVAPFFVDFHHFLSIFTIFYRFSRFMHFCRDLHFVAIYALFPQIFFGQNSLLRNITRFLHVWTVQALLDERMGHMLVFKSFRGEERISVFLFCQIFFLYIRMLVILLDHC